MDDEIPLTPSIHVDTARIQKGPNSLGVLTGVPQYKCTNWLPTARTGTCNIQRNTKRRFSMAIKY